LSRAGQRLLAGQPVVEHAPAAAGTANGSSVGIGRLLAARTLDARRRLDLLEEIIDSSAVPRADHEAVAGRFYRLQSAQEYALNEVSKTEVAGVTPGMAAAQLTAFARGRWMYGLTRETIDFLGGVLMREDALDHGHCRIGDALLRELVLATGVNWASRCIPGRDPLFSPSADLVHVRFLDWDIWNLPLLAHEFGHIVALATEAFQAWQRQAL